MPSSALELDHVPDFEVIHDDARIAFVDAHDQELAPTQHLMQGQARGELLG
jgi:hypothetical protein